MAIKCKLRWLDHRRVDGLTPDGWTDLCVSPCLIFSLDGRFKASHGFKHPPIVIKRLPLILTLNKHADDQSDLWLCGGAGQYTDVILQTVRDPIPLRAKALSLFIIFDKV
jgi:hypothetical protein